MTWKPLFSNVFLATPTDVGSGGFVPIPPFSFQVVNQARLLIEAFSESAKAHWWSAGWLNAILYDARLPTFWAIESWQRLPLGYSLYKLPSFGIYQIRIEPHDYLSDFVIRVWATDESIDAPPGGQIIYDGGIY